uniref:NADH dehydrogenase subunit 4 n=1 Tax=Bostrychia tenuissima TaxID=196631 RepID=UPI002E76FC74|nr:NADH dehydrogenase subunit 4 [Bostrychia tenuissima]WQF69446.1 NADH dehydrogenase subunit 4 [Bostrychia tenuissima]
MFTYILKYNPIIFISCWTLCSMFMVMFMIPSHFNNLTKSFATISSSLVFLMTLNMWLCFDSFTSLFQFTCTFSFMPYLNLTYSTGMDGISLFFLILTTFTMTVCMLISWNTIQFFLKEYLVCFLVTELCLIQVFCITDMFWFYVFFESVTIPMFLMIGIWGSRERKTRAAIQFFLFTLMGSFFMTVALIFIYSVMGTTNLLILWFIDFPKNTQLILWLGFFFGFAVKVPMLPFHMWLPEAHAEAPTSGSVILAGMTLKLGGYGFLRFSTPLFPFANVYFSPLVFLLSLLAIVYGSLTTLRQIDLKKMIAYSSMSHMGFVTLGIFSLNVNGIEGSIILMLSHGLISSALFFCVGITYDRHHTRILKYYSGTVQVMPIFVIFFSFFSFANIGLPGTSSFIGEFLILNSLLKVSFVLTSLATLGIVLSASYAIWLVNRISFNTLKIHYFSFFQDVSRREFIILLLFSFTTSWVGTCPGSFLNEINFSVLNLIEHLTV